MLNWARLKCRLGQELSHRLIAKSAALRARADFLESQLDRHECWTAVATP